MALKLGELVTFLKGDDKHLKETFEKARKKLDDFGSSAAGKAAKIGASMGIALGGAFLANLALDQSTQAGIVAARLGINDPAAIGRLGKMAGELYADNFLASMEDVTEALSLVGRSRVLVPSGTDEEIRKITDEALTLSTVLGQDIPRVVAAAESMITSGIAKNATEAFDLLARGIQTGADKAEDLADTFIEYSILFRDLGLTGAEALGLINQALAAGARNSDVAADALKEFAIRGQDASVASAEGFKILGLNAEEMTRKVASGGASAREALGTVLDRLREMEDPVARNAAAVALFGTKAEDLADSLFAMDLDTATEQLGEFAGATEKAGQAVEETAGAKVEKFKRAMQQGIIEQLAKVIGWLETAHGFYKEHEEILGPVAYAILTVAGAIGVLVVAIKVITAVQAIWNIVMMANPIGLIVAAIVVLIAIIWLLVANWDKVWSGIKDGALAIGRWFRDVLWGQWIKGAWDAILGAGEAVVNWFRDLPGRIADHVRGMWDSLVFAFKAAINHVIRLWNDFSLTLGGGEILGLSIPSITLHTPDIPYLAKGGIVPATPGGRLIVAGEGGRDEIVAPEPTLEALTRRAVADAMRELGDLGVGEVCVHVYLDGEPVRHIARAEVVRAGQRSADWARAARPSRRR